MPKWEKFFDEKIREIAKRDYIVDIGGGVKFGKEMSTYAALFKGKRYVVLDKEASYRPDIVGDIHNIPLDDASVDGVICKAVLQHVERPSKAVSEIYRILKPGGQALFYVPFLYPYHARPGVYQDFYRFSRDAVEYLFKGFSELEYVSVRGFFETWLNFLPAGLNRILNPLGRLLDKVFKGRGNQTSGFNIYVVK